MQFLNTNEIEAVSGAGTPAAPIDNPSSELGKSINDVAGGLNSFGSWLGGWIYDQVHSN